MANSEKGAALITGASSGIGAVYADRLARRGHDLVLVARDEARLADLAKRLRADYGVQVDVLKADLTEASDLAQVEERLRRDGRINVLVNNAGAAVSGGFADGDLEAQDRLIRLNVTAVTRLARVIAPQLIAKGGGAIINIASVVAVAPEFFTGIYPATKAYVLAFSQSLQLELGPKGVYVQAVLPAATRTEIWERSGRPIAQVEATTPVMGVDEMVDAALVGFDRKELVTIPSLPDEAQWRAFDAARQAMLPNFGQHHAAARYRA